MNIQPEILALPPATFIGMQARFISAASEGANNMRVIPRLWEAFLRREREVPSYEPGVRYGLCKNLDAHGVKHAVAHEALYLAGARADPDAPIPDGMTRWDSLGGRFAKFEHRGALDDIGKTMAYIHGEWLPKSGYIPGEGPAIERYDERFDPASRTVVFEIFVPLVESPAREKP